MEAILSATALGGEIMLHPHELGKVQPGYYADLILVDGDPSEDITVLSGHKHIDLVMVVSQARLVTQLRSCSRMVGFTRKGPSPRIWQTVRFLTLPSD